VLWQKQEHQKEMVLAKVSGQIVAEVVAKPLEVLVVENN